MAAESKLESRISQFCKENGILAYKFVSPGRRGVPDRIYLKDGITCFIELKAPNKYPTPLQYREMAILEGQGFEVMWTWDYEVAVNFLKRVFHIPNA